tara:strand:- start:695 stop:2734 length:2040 start_codon:yes stop_codon:yes gene_type:complete
MSHTFLFELGTEELPPLQLRGLRDALVAGFTNALDDNALGHGDIRGYATPRRLALLVNDLAAAQPDTQSERRGPKVDVAFDADGNPTKAASGFAVSCGVDVADLDRMKTDKGEWLLFREDRPGRQSKELLPSLLSEVVGKLGTERMMRWGSTRTEFVRPAQWLVMLLDDEIVEGNILGHASGRTTRGHRFMGAGTAEISSANDYIEVLRQLKVVADQDDRSDIIEAQLLKAAGDDQLNENAALLDEVAALTEWPVVLRGDFPAQFLELPDEVLISAMEKHQRYFALRRADGSLAPSFLMIANLDSSNPSQVILGNERVIRPRLADGEFFWNADTQTRLSDRVSQLGSLVFQATLGSYEQKTRRIQHIATALASGVGADKTTTARAAELCKADLVTDMVIEFTDLQGIMGGHYARHDGESQAVAEAITQHYRPTGAGSPVPDSLEGCCVAIADKADNLVGLFGIGEPPTGSRDPFGLRRAALGVIRIVLERELPLSLGEIFEAASTAHDGQFETQSVLDYLIDRLRYYYVDRGIAVDVVNAAFGAAGGVNSLLDTDARVQALDQFRQSAAGKAAAASNKRVANILSRTETASTVNADRFEEAAERELSAQIDEARGRIESANDYRERLAILAGMQPALDRFFEDVMVMADDDAVRDNRLALLQSARALFLTVGDLSELQG